MTKVCMAEPSWFAWLPKCHRNCAASQSKAILLRLIIALQIIVTLSSCATNPPSYTPSLAASETLEELALNKMRTKEFSSATPDVEILTIRGGTFNAPHGDSFANYLRKALQKELEMAGLWDESSSTTISGVFLENHLDASGINIGVADLSAEFFISVDDAEVYRQVHSIHHEWDSSFLGAVAIPRANDNYVIAVRQLLLQLFTDPEFIRAVGPDIV